jgi:V8-like Glu-specific endopeptidase
LKNYQFILCLFFISTTVYSKPQIEKIIGQNDLVIVDSEVLNIPPRYKNIVNAFGNVRYEEKNGKGQLIDTFYGCTGTHMGQGYVITAGHCVGASDTVTSKSDCSFISGSSEITATEIHFGYRDQRVKYTTSKCIEVIAAMKNDDLGFDFAILKVSPAPTEVILPDTSRRSIFGDSVTVFSHPQGEVLQWSRACGVERVLNPLIPDSFIQHQCDTRPGSSGAAIIDMISMKIVGIHDGGINDFDEATGVPLSTGMNYATYIMNSPLYDELKKIGF